MKLEVEWKFPYPEIAWLLAVSLLCGPIRWKVLPVNLTTGHSQLTRVDFWWMAGGEYQKTPRKTLGGWGEGEVAFPRQAAKTNCVWLFICLAVLLKRSNFSSFFFWNKVSISLMNIWQFYIQCKLQNKISHVINSFFPSSYQMLKYGRDKICMKTFRLPTRLYYGWSSLFRIMAARKLGREKIKHSLNQKPELFVHPKRNDWLRERDWKNKSKLSFSPKLSRSRNLS